MPNWRIIEKEDCREEVTEWIGLTEKEEQIANSMLKHIFTYGIIKFEYHNGKSETVEYAAGLFWINNRPKPFYSSHSFERFVEKAIPQSKLIIVHDKHKNANQSQVIEYAS